MMRSKISLIFGLMVCAWSLSQHNEVIAQKISNVDFDEVKAATTDSTSKYFYKHILEKIANYDGYISSEAYYYLYYGNVYHEAYNPYGTHDKQDTFRAYLAKKKYRKAIPYGKEILAENPVNLAITYDMLVCYHELDVKDTARIYGERYYNMLDVISNSGDGLNPESAFVVIKVNDEYQLLRDMQLESAGQSLLYTEFGPVDKLKIAAPKKKKDSDQKKLKEIYFNVSLLFEHMKMRLKTAED